MSDPTYDEMKSFVIGTGAPINASDYIEEGIYWFASRYHNGQGSNLYAAMCQCDFQPGPIAVLSSESVASIVFEMLEEEYCRPTTDQFKLLLAEPSDIPLPEDKDLYDPV